jgi:succinate dehydrogenase / fumarate reductase cytochrome b subunit
MAGVSKIPRAFFWRRLHSFTGFFLTLFLIEHLLVNSQAALFFGDDGSGFVHAANAIKNLPYLPIIEIILLGIPILIHTVWGITYLYTGKLNSFPSDGTTPSLPEYSRNQAYSWQRITSWILLLALVLHIIHMRFVEYPAFAKVNGHKYYMVHLDRDEGLVALTRRLNVSLYDTQKIEKSKQTPYIFDEMNKHQSVENEENSSLIEEQIQKQQQAFISALERRPLKPGQVIAVAPDFGTAELLMVRETFKMPVMIALYTIFVLSACYHGFNGLWTFMVTWGVTLTQHSQKIMRHISTLLMLLIAFLGLSSIWATYWINLKQ